MSEAQGQAPAASPRTSPIASVVTNPGMSPVDKIQALLQTEKPVQAGEKMVQQPPANPATAPVEPEAPAEPAAEPAAPATTEQPNEVEEATPAPSDAKAREIPLDELEAIELEITVKGEDGKDVTSKRTIKELRDGHMMQADYSRKTAELARQRESVSEEVRKGVESERAAYFQTLQTLEDVVIGSIDTELKTANWSELARDDPATYVRLDNRRKELDRTLSEIQTKKQDVIRTREAERAKARDEQALKSWDVLEKKIPAWDSAKYQSLMKAASETYGYKPDEVGSWVDHKAFEVLHDALEYRKLKSQTKPDAPIATKKVVVVPKAVTPGAAQPQNAKQSRESEAMKQLQKRGTVQDAAAVIKARMG